jgi:hypothetical protein
MTRSSVEKRIVAFYPVSNAVGFAVLEGQELLDWGMVQLKVGSPRDGLTRIATLIERYSVDAVITEDHYGKTRRGLRVKNLLSGIKASALGRKKRWKGLSRDQVREMFAGTARTRYEIAVALAERFPELALRLPPKSKAWTSEDHRVAVFDAVAFGLTYISGLKRSKGRSRVG